MRPIHIMCGGSTSIGTLSKLSPVIAVNRDMFRYLDAEYFVTCDYSFARRHRMDINEFKGTTVFVNNLEDERIIKHDIQYFDMIINTKEHSGFSPTFKNFGTGQNSGFSAVQLAIILGFKEIHLYGLDLIFTDKSHWHEGYGHEYNFLQDRLRTFYEFFKDAIPKCKDVRFISHSPISRLNGLPNVISAIS